MSTTIGHLPSNATRIKSCAAAAADFQHPLKGAQGGKRERRYTVLGEKLAGQAFR